MIIVHMRKGGQNMTIQELMTIKEAVCPHDEDYSEPCISPEYLERELEELFVMLCEVK